VIEVEEETDRNLTLQAQDMVMRGSVQLLGMFGLSAAWTWGWAEA